MKRQKKVGIKICSEVRDEQTTGNSGVMFQGCGGGNEQKIKKKEKKEKKKTRHSSCFFIY